MWVTKSKAVEALNLYLLLGSFVGFTHNLTHRLKGLISPLTWGYVTFPQVSGLVTTTTYNYMKTPVRFPLIDFQNFKLLKIKNLQSFTTAGRLTK
jgi:hypothetical protein